MYIYLFCGLTWVINLTGAERFIKEEYFPYIMPVRLIALMFSGFQTGYALMKKNTIYLLVHVASRTSRWGISCYFSYVVWT